MSMWRTCAFVVEGDAEVMYRVQMWGMLGVLVVVGSARGKVDRGKFIIASFVTVATHLRSQRNTIDKFVF